MLKYRFDNFLAFLNNKNIIIITHDLVDIDGLVSCFTLRYFLKQYFKKQKITIYFSEFTKSAKNYFYKITEKFPEFDFSYDKTFPISSNDVVLILDTNNPNQIELNTNLNIFNLNIPLIYIDHHYLGEKSENDSFETSSLIFENYSSTSEIILDLYDLYNVPLTIPLKILMITAIITDSGFFKHGSNKTIQNVSKLIGEDINIQDVFLLLKNETDISEKIAKIKGMQRVKLIREQDFLIGITNVSSYGASVATMLIKLGFDIAIVLSKEVDQYRINTRAKKVICLNTGLHLGKVLEEISKNCNGNGGGHNGAASITINKEPDTIINYIIEKIKNYI
ncbi:MAG: bifunctional oligoribonuclease/PAP phosphatase NrnA [Candidatus Hermodarchaeota archaeon]